MIGRFYRTSLALCLAALLTVSTVVPAFAQQQPGQQTTPGQSPVPAPSPSPIAGTRVLKVSDQNYGVPTSWFPHVLLPYKPVTVPDPVLTNSPTIGQLVQGGNLTLSLQDAVDLALQNNLDISIQRYTPWLAEANILRAQGGGVPRAGGAGSVTALGTFPTVTFDPTLTTTLSTDQRNATANNPLTAGSGTGTGSTFGVVNTHTATGNMQYSQGFHTGTSFTAAFTNVRQSTSVGTVFFNPSILSTFNITANQQLLNGFGLLPNERNIRLAIINKSSADLTFKQQVITSITAVANAYWELVFARGNVVVNQQSVALAQKLYDDNKKQVEIGTLAPLEIIRAEAQLASAQQGLIAAQTVQIQDQITLLNLITKDPSAPPLLTVEVVPTDSAVTPPGAEDTIPLTDAIKEAVSKRPDVLQAITTLKGDDINVHTTRNALLPTLNLSAFYAAQGLAGNRAASSTAAAITSGLGTALEDELRGVYPEYNAQINLTIPIRNRQAQADNATALLTKNLDQARFTQVVNAAVNDVHNTQITLAQNRVAVDAAIKTRELQQETLDAEQKKFALGASTIFQIVSDQRDLATAAAQEVRALVNLAQAKVNFERAMATTLEVYNITISDAKSGAAPRDTLIPGTSSKGELIGRTATALEATVASSNRSTSYGGAK
jgi:outer membrane protein